MPTNLLDKPILMYDRIFKAVVADQTDTRLLDCILSDILDEKVHVVEFIPTELKVRKTTERVKVTDLIVETDNKEHILVELNSNYDNTTKLRNLSYYAAYYSQVIERGKIYDKKLKTVLINLNKVAKEKLAKKTYLLTCNEDGSIYTNTFKIIDVNLVNYKETCYDKCIEGKTEHIHLVMLNSNIEEIKKLGKRDKIIRKSEEKMLTITKNGVVLNHLSDKEEEEKMLRSRLQEAKEDGIEQGLIEKSEEIAINLLKMNMSLDDIEKATGLTKKELEELKTEM